MKTKFTSTLALAGVPLLISPLAYAQEDDDAHHEIDNIIVTATPLSRTVEQLAQPTTVLHGDELAMKQSTSIGETISQEPGVSSTYFGPVSSRPVIRGQFGERVRVLSNGLDSLDASALSEDHQVTVEGLLADRIEIIRGPATLLYGSGAAGGLVNVVDTRFIETPLDKPFSAGIALGADTAVGNRDAAVRSHFGFDSVAFNVDYFTRSTDNIEIPGYAESQVLRDLEEAEGGEEEEGEEEAFGVVENSDSETSGGAVGMSIVGDAGFIGISVSGFDSEYGVPGHHHHEEEEPGPVPPIEAEEEAVRIDLEQTRVDLKGEYEVDGSFLNTIKFRAAVNDYEHVELEGEEVGTFFSSDGTDGRLEFEHARFGRWEGAVGVQYKRVDFDAIGDEAFVPSSDTTQTSVFVFEEFALNDDWVFQGSARYEQQSIDGSDLAVEYSDGAVGLSIGAIWRPIDALRVSGNLSLTERHPNATELYADGPHVAAQRYERGSVTLGNGILDKEMSTNLDVTLHGDMGRWEWTVTGFVNSVEDYVLLRPTTDEIDGFQVYDFDQADVDFIGAEAELLFEILDSSNSHLHLSAFTDFVRAEEDATGDNLPRIPPMRFGLGLHGNWNQFDASVDVTFADEQDDVAPNELPTEEYTLLNASVSYAFADTDLYLFLRGTNLLDEEIRQHTSPLKDLVPLPGRSLHAGLRFEF